MIGKKYIFRQNVIALNILFVLYNTEKIRLAYKSKHNLKHENQVILLMITDSKSWHYLAVKSLSALLRGITSNHDGDFYCLNCFRSYRTEKKLKKHESVCNDHEFCCVEMPDEGNKILKYNYGEKSLKGPFMIYAAWSVCLKKCTHVKIILKNLIQRKKLGIRLLVTHCLQIVCLMQQKLSLIVTEAKIVRKSFAETR